jgi:hypothetical protein
MQQEGVVCSVEFGVKIGGSGGLILSAGSDEANLKVVLDRSWHGKT